MNRRSYLGTVAGTGVASLAGCVDAVGDWRGSSAVRVPESASVTERLNVVVEGVDTERVWVEAHAEDGAGAGWTGRALFETEGGRVDLRTARPMRGTYETPAGMGPFWSMQPDDLRRQVYDTDQRSQSVRLRVRPEERDTVPVATATVDRHVAAPSAPETDVEEPVVGTLVESPDDGPAPGVVLFHGSGGTRPVAPARALASRGFTVLALQYVSPTHPGLPDALVEVPVEYADRAVEWLADHGATTDDPVGLGGFSRGGELALLVGTRHEVGAVVNWVGAGILFNAVVLTDDRQVSPKSPDTAAWTLDGEPLPHPSREAFDPGLDLETAYRQWLDDTPDETLRAAEIPLERIRAPILLVSAGDDGVWPSRYLQNRAEARLDAMDYEYRVEHHSYDGAGHGVGVPFLPTWPNRPSGPFGGTLAETAVAEADSWPRAVEYFEPGARRSGASRSREG
jgi:nucleolar protein 56